MAMAAVVPGPRPQVHLKLKYLTTALQREFTVYLRFLVETLVWDIAIVVVKESSELYKLLS